MQPKMQLKGEKTGQYTRIKKNYLSFFFNYGGRTELCRQLLLKYAPYLKATLEKKLILYKYL
jgi:hypothetical protein